VMVPPASPMSATAEASCSAGTVVVCQVIVDPPVQLAATRLSAWARSAEAASR
jgi:hypothetical protein